MKIIAYLHPCNLLHLFMKIHGYVKKFQVREAYIINYITFPPHTPSSTF